MTSGIKKTVLLYLLTCPLVAAAEEPEALFVLEGKLEFEPAATTEDRIKAIRPMQRAQRAAIGERAELQLAGRQLDELALDPGPMTFDERMRRRYLAVLKTLPDESLKTWVRLNPQLLQDRVLRDALGRRGVHPNQELIQTAFLGPASSTPKTLGGFKVIKVTGRVALVYETERMDVSVSELSELVQPAGPEQVDSWIYRLVNSWVQHHAPTRDVVGIDVVAVKDDASLGHTLTTIYVDMFRQVDVLPWGSVQRIRDDRKEYTLLGLPASGPKPKPRAKAGAAKGVDKVCD